MMQYMFITNDPNLAKYAEACGVGRIFVDLETIGKKERQGHLDTLISKHSPDDIYKVKSAIDKAKLLVRLNPLHKGSKSEVDIAIANGADMVMLPMFRTSNELMEFSSLVDGRVGIIPLVETYDAAKSIDDIIKVPGLTEIYIGLNDLHLDMKLDFIFEPLASGFVDNMVSVIKSSDLPFGFGGIARIGEGVVPGEMVLGEHMRLGSNSVILSRTFHRENRSIEYLDTVVKFKEEVKKLKQAEQKYKHRSHEEIESDRKKFQDVVSNFVNERRNETSL